MNALLLGWRKTAYWVASNGLMVWGAIHFKGTFSEFRDGVVILAGMVLAAHTAQQMKGAPNAVAK